MCPGICRPLTAAVAAAGRGTFTLDGVPRMRERPIQDLVDGLVQLGVSASCTMGTGCPPVTVEAQGLPSGTVCAPSLFALRTPYATTADWRMRPGPGQMPALCPAHSASAHVLSVHSCPAAGSDFASSRVSSQGVRAARIAG